MATFEQGLDKAFEIAWRHSQRSEAIREEVGSDPESIIDQLRVASSHEAFIGALDVLGSLLLLAGKIPVFTPSTEDEGQTQGWIDGSAATANSLMGWARRNDKVTEAEYAGWCAISGVPASAFL